MSLVHQPAGEPPSPRESSGRRWPVLLALAMLAGACIVAHANSAEPLEVLAIALAAAGRPEDAIRAAQQALALVRAAGDTARARALEARIDQYARQRREGARQSSPDLRAPSPPSP